LRAVIMQDLDVLTYDDVAIPLVESGGLLIKVEACSMCATDLKLLRYGHPGIKTPHVLGHEIAGTVAEVGGDDLGFKKGDRVAVGLVIPCNMCIDCVQGFRTACKYSKRIGYDYWGGFAQYVAVPAAGVKQRLVKRIPDHVPFDQAALMEPLACVLHGHNKVNTHPGDRVVVIGLGPIGSMHIAMAKARGAAKVIAVDVLPERIELARRFNADLYVNSAKTNLTQLVKDETEGRGADVVIVATIAKGIYETVTDFIAPGGRILAFSGFPKDKPWEKVDINAIHYKEALLIGSSAATPEDCDAALGMIASGQIDAGCFISHRVGLAQVQEAIEMIRRGESIKIIVNPWL
jgi:L-iditol 2-dehydrogenase